MPIQKYLLRKYVPEIRPNIIQLDNTPLNFWCSRVAELIEETNPSESIVLILDDHLILDRVVRSVSMPQELERLELGKITRNHKTCRDEGKWYLSYSNDTPYKVSCQPSIWRTEALIRVLKRVNGSPWDFERQGVCAAGIVREPIIDVADESALSKRWEGVNLRGMKKEDVDYIIKKGWIAENDIQRNNN